MTHRVSGVKKMVKCVKLWSKVIKWLGRAGRTEKRLRREVK